MVESTTVKEDTSYDSILDVFDSIIQHLITNKTGVAYMKLNWKRSEHDDDKIETEAALFFNCSDVDAIH